MLFIKCLLRLYHYYLDSKLAELDYRAYLGGVLKGRMDCIRTETTSHAADCLVILTLLSLGTIRIAAAAISCRQGKHCGLHLPKEHREALSASFNI